jgi:lipoprotein-anchoring transpeptidase ErfK/SrfK
MKKSLFRIVTLSIAVAMLLSIAAVPAFAGVVDTVPNHAFVGSTDLYGLGADEARAVIAQEASVTLLPKLNMKAAGRSFSLEASKCLELDVETMLAAAYAASPETTFTIPRSAVVSSTPVWAKARAIAKSIKRSKSSASYYKAGGGKLKWKKAVYGRSLYTTAAVTAITNSLSAEATQGVAQPTLTLKYKSYTPKVTDKKLGRAIIVDLSQRKLRLYDHSKVMKKYGVAIGTAAHPTPVGTFKVIAKAKNPAWRNPGSAWAAGMPSYIAPGPHNPLGVRALYINSSGIRIHGTYKSWSIGHAASHGCMRMNNSTIVKLYPLVPVGTPVFITK